MLDLARILLGDSLGLILKPFVVQVQACCEPAMYAVAQEGLVMDLTWGSCSLVTGPQTVSKRVSFATTFARFELGVLH